MKQAVKFYSFLVIIMIFGSNVFAQKNLFEIIDGRKFQESPDATQSKIKLIEKEVKFKERAIKNIAKKNDFKCDENDAKENLANENVVANLDIYDVLKGSFTKPKSSQKAFFYQVCWSDGGKYATALGGIIVVEKQKVVTHFIYANVSGFNDVRVFPDINRNGLSEIGLRFASKIDGLLVGRSIGIFEIGANKITELGETETDDMTADEDMAYNISVRADKTPVFYREIFIDKGANDNSDWKLKQKLKRFSLDKPDSKNEFDFVKLPRER